MLRASGLLYDELRLQAVSAVLPSDPGADHDFDRLARLAAKALRTPTSFITLIDESRQHFRGACGPSWAMGDSRSGPHANSLFRHTVVEGVIVSIPDVGADPLFSGNATVEALGIRAYIGIPLVTTQGHTIGSICGIDYEPREWTAEEIDLLRDYAAIAVGQLEATAISAKIRVAFDVALHDLKTPLSGLTMASSLVTERMSSIPVELHPLLKAVEISTAAAVKLVETLALEQQTAAYTDCLDPVRTATQVISRLRDRAAGKGMSVEFVPERSRALRVPPWVLEQILENLTSNAIKFGPPESVVSVSFRVEDGAGHFHVRDQGPGFSDEDRERMFARYTRLSALPTGGEPSTGLGLSIVKRLTEQHHGKVELVSPAGRGAEFRLGFPLAD